MKDRINDLLSEVKAKISESVNEGELMSVKSAFLGKQGAVSLLMKEMPKLDKSERPEMGKLLNQAKNQITELIDEKRTELKLKASEVSPDFDCSVPGILPPGGGLHPITQMCYDLNDAFRSMGFEMSRLKMPIMDFASIMYLPDIRSKSQSNLARILTKDLTLSIESSDILIVLMINAFLGKTDNCFSGDV